MVRRITQNDIAAHFGVTSAAITKMKRQGMPVDSIEKAHAWREKNSNIAARPKGGRPRKENPPDFSSMPEEDFQAARTRREIAEANLAEHKEKELAGELIRVDAMRAAWAKRITATRDALLQLPHRLAPVLAAQSDMVKIGQLMDAELRQALTELVKAE